MRRVKNIPVANLSYPILSKKKIAVVSGLAKGGGKRASKHRHDEPCEVIRAHPQGITCI
jgi:hypothetical protein